MDGFKFQVSSFRFQVMRFRSTRSTERLETCNLKLETLPLLNLRVGVGANAKVLALTQIDVLAALR